MLRTEIIDVPKEAMKCDWDDEDNLENELEYTPPEAAGVTRQCNPRNKSYPLIKFLNEPSRKIEYCFDRAYGNKCPKK